jgi:penicillin-binding protein 2
MSRNFLLYFLVIAVGILLIGRLFQLQIINGIDDNPIYNSAVKTLYDYPERGYVYDRNGKLLVANQLSYDVMIQPNEVQPLDTLEFCNLLKISKEKFIEGYKRAYNYAPYLASPFLKQLAKDDYAYLQEKLHKYPGFYIQKRIIRDYPINSAANVLGYIGEVNENLAKINPYYQAGELTGKSGVEKEYEDYLRGIKGKKLFSRDRFNKITGSYKNGELDTIAENGKDLVLTIDSELQQYAEALMNGKRGGIVAIEPSTGEILTLVTAPSYDPNMMVGRKRSENSVLLFGDTISQPTFDRSLNATYSPGSPFKMMNALVALQEGLIDENTSFYCFGGFKYGNSSTAFMKCHCGIYGKPIQLETAIAKSCNTYFGNAYKRIIEHSRNSTKAMNEWNRHVTSFGFGNYLGYDLPTGQKGLIPDGDYYNNIYKYSWNGSTTISNAIGQGEVLSTPIQLANFTAVIANKGFYYTPHIVKKLDGSAIKNEKFTTKNFTTVDKKHFTPVFEAMHEVFKTGTGSRSQVPGIEICGKTGTVENFTRINGQKIQLPDHSVLVAFAPKDNPKIAIAVFVENGGFGSAFASPIVSLLIEKYINKEVKRKQLEERMLTTSLADVYKKQIPKALKIEAGTQ